MLAIAAGDHAAIQFDTFQQFTDNTVDLTRQALTHGAQVMIVPAADEFAAVQKIICGADVGRAVGAGQIRFADPRTVRSPSGRFDADYLHRVYAAAALAAVDGGYSGLWLSADMRWARPGVADPDLLIAFEAESYALFDTGRLTALCQYHTGTFAPSRIRQACQAHPSHPDGLRLRHEFADAGRLLRLSGETDMANGTAFGVLVAAMGSGGAIDITTMSFIDVRGLECLAKATRRRPEVSVVCTGTQAAYLGVLGAEPDRLIVGPAGRPSTRRERVPAIRGGAQSGGRG